MMTEAKVSPTWFTQTTIADVAAALAFIEQAWPFDRRWFKPTDPRRDLVKAAALILAEIDRMDRASSLKETER